MADSTDALAAPSVEQPASENGHQINGGKPEAMDQLQDPAAPGVKEDDRKLFVGGLSWETTEQDLKEFFAKFGEMDNVNVKTDPTTGRSRGFAFIVFKAADSVENVLAAGDITIHNKKVEAKRAKARPGKIFVGGVPPEVSDDDIKKHFAAFGKVIEMETPFDKVRNQRKGFVFVTFESEYAMKDVLRNPKQTIGGKEVDIKRATPRGDLMGPGGFMRGGGVPHRGGFRGGPGGLGAPMIRGSMRGGPRGAMGGGMSRGGAWGGQQQGWGGAQAYGFDLYGGGYGGGRGGGGGVGGGYGYEAGYNTYGGYGTGGYGVATYNAGGYAGGGYGGPQGPTRRAGRGSARGQRFDEDRDSLS